ncbi:hypothetical protein AB0D66_32855 [Streptomyces sp. NPDC048270]
MLNEALAKDGVHFLDSWTGDTQPLTWALTHDDVEALGELLPPLAQYLV